METKGAPGTAPARLDDNRSAGYGLAATAIVDLFVPFVCPPVACTGVNIGGRVVPKPKVVTLYWDDDWDAHNPSSPTRAAIDDAVSRIVGGDYLDFANQYGVSRGTTGSSHGSSALCGTRRPSGPTDFGSLIAWVTCEVQDFLTGVGLPDNDTLYAVFVPEGTTITGAVNANCSPTVAVHMWSAAIVPDPQIYNPLAYKIEGFPFTVVPAECALAGSTAATFDNFTANWSHELIEASLDPFAPSGWIDNTFSNDIVKWTSLGEAGDICSSVGAVPTAAVRLSSGLLVSTYWSNHDDACVPLGDTTPPVVAPVVTGTLGSNGWYVSNVTVSWTVSDPDSSFTTSGCDPVVVAADTAGVTLTCTATSAGGTSSQSVTIRRDATPPTVSYAGDAGTYTVDQSVAITCTAADTLSGVASTTCADVVGPAWSFGLGPHTVAASAVDRAGNVGTGSASFEVDVTFDSLCALGRSFSTRQRVADRLCHLLARASRARCCEQLELLEEYREELREHRRALTPAQATTLADLSRALVPNGCTEDGRRGHDRDHRCRGERRGDD